MVAALQQSVEQKDAIIRAKDELVQEKERGIRELQQRVRGRERERSGGTTRRLKLKWRYGQQAPFATKGYSVGHSADIAYFVDSISFKRILKFNSATHEWTVLSECPKQFFSIAVVNEHLTAIGGKQSYKDTNTLLNLPQDRHGIFQQKWIEQLPPMAYCRSSPAVATTSTSLIVAGGRGPDEEKAPVEVLDSQTLHWSIVASLPHSLWQAIATIYENRLYIGGGFSSDQATKSVLMCEVTDLLQSQTQSLIP